MEFAHLTRHSLYNDPWEEHLGACIMSTSYFKRIYTWFPSERITDCFFNFFFIFKQITFLGCLDHFSLIELLFKVPVHCNSKLKFIKYKPHPGSNFRNFWLYINFFHALNVPDSNSEKLVPTFEYFQGNVAEGSNRLDHSYFYCIYPHLKI